MPPVLPSRTSLLVAEACEQLSSFCLYLKWKHECEQRNSVWDMLTGGRVPTPRQHVLTTRLGDLLCQCVRLSPCVSFRSRPVPARLCADGHSRHCPLGLEQVLVPVPRTVVPGPGAPVCPPPCVRGGPWLSAARTQRAFCCAASNRSFRAAASFCCRSSDPLFVRNTRSSAETALPSAKASFRGAHL